MKVHLVLKRDLGNAKDRTVLSMMIIKISISEVSVVVFRVLIQLRNSLMQLDRNLKESDKTEIKNLLNNFFQYVI